MIVACVFFEHTKGFLRTLHISKKEIICIFSRLNHFVSTCITLCITSFHSGPIRYRKSVVTDFFTKLCKFICEHFVIHNKSEILLNNTKSFACTVDIGIYNCWVHSPILRLFSKKSPTFVGDFETGEKLFSFLCFLWSFLFFLFSTIHINIDISFF